MPPSRKQALKSKQFDANIKKRGSVPQSDRAAAKTGYSVGPVALGFFLFVVVGSAILQIISAAQKGIPGM